MSKAHSFLIVLFAVAIVSGSPSCSAKTKEDEKLIEMLENNLTRSNAFLNSNTEDVLSDLELKTGDLSTYAKAKIWQPKAMAIQAATNEFEKYIESVKTDLQTGRIKTIDRNKADEILRSLLDYKTRIWTVDQDITNTFQHSLVFISPFLDSVGASNQGKIKQILTQNSISKSLAMLTLMQSNAKIVENRTIKYCFNKTDVVALICIFNSSIVSQSSSYVRAGEKMEITAGVGTFDRRAIPSITFNGKPAEPSYDGIARYSFRAPSKPGKYTLPVELSYIDQDANKQIEKRIIEYTVAKECDAVSQ